MLVPPDTNNWNRRCPAPSSGHEKLVVWMLGVSLVSLVLLLPMMKEVYSEHQRSRSLHRMDVHLTDVVDPLTSPRTTSLPNTTTGHSEEGYTLCPEIPPQLVGLRRVNLTVPASLSDVIRQVAPTVTLGGSWKPATCRPLSKLAVVIPYSDRHTNLLLMLQHLHPFLQRQLIEYRIFIIEPTEKIPFNRGLLKNIGFLEANKNSALDCTVFHDLDLLPENDFNLYHCPDSPRHLVVAIDTFNYKPLARGGKFGGAVLFRNEQFVQVNGYSNYYFQWGSEDSDLMKRVLNAHLPIKRYKANIGRYTEAKHKKQRRFIKHNMDLYRHWGDHVDVDGLNSLKYDVVKKRLFATHTWLNVHYDEKYYTNQSQALLHQLRIRQKKND